MVMCRHIISRCFILGWVRKIQYDLPLPYDVPAAIVALKE